MRAEFSQCGTYRYTLTRYIEQPTKGSKGALFIMLNPSTADAKQDDPTIRRCISFAKREGCTMLTVVNLFAFRATNPKELALAKDPIGPLNDHHIANQIEAHNWGLIVAAWGSHPIAKDRGEWFCRNGTFWCLGKTKDGSPRHPLYVKTDQPLILLSDS